MLKCPQCDTDLKQDFGMVTCDHCKAVLMIDISGHVQIGSNTPFEESLGEELDADQFGENTSSFNHEDSTDPNQASFDDTDADSAFFESRDDVLPGDDYDNAFDSEHEEPLGEEDSDDFVTGDYENDDIESVGGEVSEELPRDLTEEINEVIDVTQIDGAHYENEDYHEELESFPMATEPDPEPVDITRFANSQDSSLEDGDLLYDLYLGRLDSKDLREALKFVLLDKKLKLNHNEFMKKIKNGEVTIPDLNPIKVKRIVEQLQYLDLDIKWKQKRVIMELVEPEVDEDGSLAEDAEI